MGKGRTDLIRDNAIRLGIVQSRHSEASRILRVDIKVDIAQMREARVNRVGMDIVPRNVFIWCDESPS